MKLSPNLEETLDTEVTLKVASKFAGKTVTAVRAWINKESVKARKVNGKWLVDSQSLKEHLATNVKPNSPPNLDQSFSNYENERLTNDYILSLTSTLERERQKVDSLTCQVEKLQSELLKLTYEMQAILKKESGNKLSRWIKDVVS